MISQHGEGDGDGQDAAASGSIMIAQTSHNRIATAPTIRWVPFGRSLSVTNAVTCGQDGRRWADDDFPPGS
ncbi:hypothetical protein [Actinoplanes sp. NPDC026670]|uniref:hypothetical protein n=1 Tax=Actinoplanes sp. NPDC026670 TaxID=3154700 RepID=UPI0033FE8094